VRAIALGVLRFVSLVAVVAAIAGIVGAIALALGNDAARAVALVLYILGALLGIVGFAAGTRGPLRPIGGEAPIIPRGVRRASLEEVVDTMRTSAFFLVAGLVLLVIGIAVDPRHDLV
jgi:hypothetical protein